MATTGTAGTAWEQWAGRELAAYPDRQAAAVAAAVEVLESGLSPTAAVAAAWVSTGAPIPSADLQALWEELTTVERVIADLPSVKPSGDLTAGALQQLARDYERRFESLKEIYISARNSRLGPGGAEAVRQRTGVPAAPAPSLRAFFSDNSILLISIAGAVLLIVSTILFEIYGTSTLGGQVRFGVVLALNLLFGAAGYVCLGRPRLRLVGQTYLAIFALMSPLTVAAAWVFLDLESQGISRELAVGAGGIACSVLYGVLALRLGSRAYGALSMLAFEVGCAGLLASGHSGAWIAPALALLTVVFVAVAFPPAGLRRRLTAFTATGELFVHGAAAVALGWSSFVAAGEVSSASQITTFQLAATFALLGLAYALYVWRSRRIWMLWTVWVAASLGVLSAVGPLGWGERGYLAALVVLAWAYAIGARRMPVAGLRDFVRVGAAVQASVPVLLSVSPDWAQAAGLLAVAGVGVLFALEDGRPAWLLLSVAIFAVDWYWLVKALVPPPPQAGPDTLALAYSPLPVIFFAFAIALKLAGRTAWSLPFHAGAAAVALGVAAVAATSGDFALAGRALAVYALLGYAAATLHRFRPAAIAALIATATAAVMLLSAAAVASPWYPVAMAILASAFYAGGLFAEPSLRRVHRIGSIALACLTAVACFGVPELSDTQGGSAASLLALAAAAALVFADGRIHARPVNDYAAAGLASLGGYWVARYAGVDNPQAYVALPGVTLVVLGLLAAYDRRRPAELTLCRLAIAAGASALLLTSAWQSIADDSASYTILWVIEAVAAMLAGIGARSRTLVLVGAVGLMAGALRAIFLILESVQVYVVFGAIAMLLLVAAGVLAATRERLAGARSAVADSWETWT